MAEALLPRLSERARQLAAGGQAGAWAIADAAMRRARQGEDIIVLTLGDPVGPPHPAIVAAAHAALAQGRTHYSPLLGEPLLREAIAGAEGAVAANVMVVPGAQHGATAVMMLIAGTGDEVLLTDPCYATYPGVVRVAGATPVRVPTLADMSVDVAGLAAAITPRTRAIFLNSPANPTGAALSPADFVQLSALSQAHNLWLVCDEVYSSFRFAGADIGAHVGAWAHGPAGRTIVLNSLSKSHAMTGFRIGWILAPTPLIAALDDWSAAALFGVSQFVQDAALAALALPADALAGYRGGFAARARQVVDRANAIAGLGARMPAGGMFVLVDCRALTADDLGLARLLLDEAGVAVVPGRGFGAGGRGHVRVSLTPDAATLAAAFDRIAAWVSRPRSAAFLALAKEGC